MIKSVQKRISEELSAIKAGGDTINVGMVFAILIAGALIAFNHIPHGLRIENLKQDDFSRLERLGALLLSFKFLCFALSFSLAQIPLEHFDSTNQKLKRNFKTILVVGAAAFAYMAFVFSY